MWLVGGYRDHRSVGYRVPKEWAALTEAQRGTGSLAAGFLAGYGAFICGLAGCPACEAGGVG